MTCGLKRSGEQVSNCPVGPWCSESSLNDGGVSAVGKKWAHLRKMRRMWYVGCGKVKNKRDIRSSDFVVHASGYTVVLCIEVGKARESALSSQKTFNSVRVPGG